MLFLSETNKQDTAIIEKFFIIAAFLKKEVYCNIDEMMPEIDKK